MDKQSRGSGDSSLWKGEIMNKELKEQNKVELWTLAAGETIKIGEYDFIVLEQQQDQTMIISKGFMEEDVVFDKNSRDYNKSSLKRLIESDIQPIIEAAELNKIVTGLRICSEKELTECNGCPYYESDCNDLTLDALAYIKSKGGENYC